jgi:TolB-like protein
MFTVSERNPLRLYPPSQLLFSVNRGSLSCFLRAFRLRLQSSAAGLELLGALLLLAALGAGCAARTTSFYVDPQAATYSRGATVAVVPFENLTAYRNAGLALTDLASSALYERDYFKVIDVSQLQDEGAIRFRRLETAAWERQLGLNPAAAAAVGREAGAALVLTGSIGEYGFVDGFGETATVGISLRLVRSEDGEVMWAGSMSRRVASLAFSEESAHRLGHQVLRKLIGRMVEDFQSGTTRAQKGAE